MDIGKVVCILAVIIVITISFIPTSRAEGRPIDDRGMPEYYDRHEEPEDFEDLFFPRIYEESSFNLDVPDYLNNTYLGSCFRYAEEYVPDDYEEKDLANITIHTDQDERLIHSLGFGAGGTNITELVDTSSVDLQVKTIGTVNFMLVESKEWDGLFQKEQTVEFTGRARTYNLFGLDGGWVEGFDNGEEFIKVNLESDDPLRYYLFENSRILLNSDAGQLVDYEEGPTTEATLELRNDDNPKSVGDEPHLTLVNPTGHNNSVEVEFSLEVKEYPPDFPLPVIIVVGALAVAIIGGVLWRKKKNSS